MATVTAPPRSPVLEDEARGGAKPLRRVLGWLLLALVLVGWAVTLRPTALGGPATTIVVSGDSMEPVLESGDLVVLREQREYNLDDIVTFRVPEGQPGGGELVIHRLIGTEGETWVPQGDNRDRVDMWRITDEDILGSLWIHVPRGGQVLMQVLQPQILAAVAGGLTTVWLLMREPKRQPASEVDEVIDEGVDEDA